jgi:hypothetical protein
MKHCLATIATAFARILHTLFDDYDQRLCSRTGRSPASAGLTLTAISGLTSPASQSGGWDWAGELKMASQLSSSPVQTCRRAAVGTAEPFGTTTRISSSSTASALGAGLGHRCVERLAPPFGVLQRIGVPEPQVLVERRAQAGHRCLQSRGERRVASIRWRSSSLPHSSG